MYQPSTKTIKINGVDKWAFLDGTLHGKLSGIYQTQVGTRLDDAIRGILSLPVYKEPFSSYFKISNASTYYFEFDGETFTSNNAGKSNATAETTLTALADCRISFKYSYSTEGDSKGVPTDYFSLNVAGTDVEYKAYGKTTVKSFTGTILKGQTIKLQYRKDANTNGNEDKCTMFDISVNGWSVDPVAPLISPYFLGKTTKVEDEEVEVLKCPYTVKVERGRTYADILLEYATILCAHIYYDVNGRLVVEPMIDTADDITDTNKEVVWHYTVDERTFLGLTQSYNFDKIYNDIIVLGNIVEGKQFKARVQNRNIMSDTCVQKIGLKTKEPFEDNQYYSDDQCKELAMYYAKVDTILQKSGSISSTPLYHFDVNKLVTVSTPNNYMSKELFLISGFTLNSSGTMIISVTSVNILKDFSVVEVELNE